MGITPSGLLERPDLLNEDLNYLDGYRFLTRSRTYGEAGPNPVAIADVQAYLSIIREDDVEERLKFLRLVQELDQVYLSHSAEKLAESAK